MQNKGFVKVIAVLFALICLFYLSFSIVSSYYEGQAKDLYGENTEKYNAYLDSLSGEKVWLSYTLKECRENELNLGLDLKGGMNVVMEVSVSDILTALAGNHSTDEAFVKAMKLAKERQLTNQKDFVDLFSESFKEVNPGVKLSSVFSTFELKDRISSISTDDEVLVVLKENVKSAVDNSFNVLRSRIDRFGVVQPNIQQLGVTGRILIEMPGVKEPERVRKLLQGSADLEFWETYDFSEIYQNILAINDMAKTIEAIDEVHAKDTVVSNQKEAETVSESDSILSMLSATGDSTVTDDKLSEQQAKQNPLITKLQLNIDFKSGQVGPGARIGVAHVKDTAKIAEYFRLAKEKRLIPASLKPLWTIKAIDKAGNYYELIAINSKKRDGKAPLTGSVITDARADFGQNSAYAQVSMEMNQEGANVWARLTKENVGKSVAVVLDGYVYSYPNVNSVIPNGRSEITGNFTPEEAKDLANVLKSGKMPAPARIVQEDVVGPSLGQEAIDAGMISFIIAFVMVLIYMMFYYGIIPGLVADLALVANVFFIFSVLASFKAVLTLPGIAGIVLTLGMAVDANVLIYERVREELRNGKLIKKALSDGYKNAFSAIIDSNVTTVLTGIILFVFGTGPIKGFATTLIIGVLCSFFTAIFLSRLIFEWLLNKTDKFNNLPFTTNITRNWFQNTHVDFVAKRKIFYFVSGGAILISLVSLVTLNLKQGVDFSGGRNYVVRFEQPVSTVDIKEKLVQSFDGQSLSVITIGESNQVRISTNFKIMEDDQNIDGEIEHRIYEGVKPLLGEDVSFDMFVNRYEKNADGTLISASSDTESTFGIQSSQKVGPTMADDIKTGAIWAVFLALVVIGIYIWIRFRTLAFSAGAVISLAHDTIIIIGLFSLLQNVMPFSMEVDQSFIAAILTVIGYSINDNVVIFDRIRENIGLYPSRDKKSVINESLNSTLSRTFSTSMSTFLVLVIIFFFGGETIRGFIFAMLVGIIVGTYSSWFVATPIAYDLMNRSDKKNVEVK